MTIYALYMNNGNRAGFWAQHRTWNNVCVYVQSIGGHEFGALPGSSPLHDNAPVEACAFDVRSGRPLSSTTYSFEPSDRAFTSIAQPPWSHRALRFRRAKNPAKATAGSHG